MYRNQYLITRKPIDFQHQLEQFAFGEFAVLSHPELERHYARSGTSKILLLGFAFSPDEPEKSTDAIVAEIASLGYLEGILYAQQALSGRYVILASIARRYFAIPDACASKHIYYSFQNGNIALTSSPKLFLDAFGFDANISPEKRQLIEDKTFLAHECAWIGDEHYDSRLKKVLPNHFLDISSCSVSRRPIFPPQRKSYQSILENTCDTLQGTFSAVLRRRPIIQPITAGLDSRILLSASKAFKNEVKYYIFKHKKEDTDVSSRLAQKLGLDFAIFDPGTLSNQFISIYKKEHVVPRILNWTSFIKYHYEHHGHNPALVNFSGNATEIVRSYYGHQRFAVPEKFFSDVIGYNNMYLKHKIREWIEEATSFSKYYGIPLLDLFYWEQRMGNWCALNAYERDIAIEEIWPFNNLNLLLNIFTIDVAKRSWPRYIFFKQLISTMWPQALEEPINPSGHRSIEYVKGFFKYWPSLWYLAHRMRGLRIIGFR